MIPLSEDPGSSASAGGVGGDRLRPCNVTRPVDPEHPDTHDCVLPYFLFHESVTRYTVIVYGHVTPAIIAVTMATNLLTCFVLTRPRMRNPTNVILVAMAASDTLTGVVPLPALVRFFTLGGCYDWVPYRWCRPYIYLTDHLPTVFHTASIWLTVVLALQRYVYIRYQHVAKRYCHVTSAVWTIFFVYVCAFAMQVPRFTELHFTPIIVQSLQRPYNAVSACYFDYAPAVGSHPTLHFSLYYWFRIVFCHLVPCSLLVGLNVRLGCTIRRSKHRHERLMREKLRQTRWGPQESGGGGGGEGNAATLMLVAVVGVAIVVEVPLACFVVVVVVENTLGVALVDGKLGVVTAFLNLCIVLAYPLNFVVYCVMSRQFRQTLVDLVRRREVTSPVTPPTLP